MPGRCVIITAHMEGRILENVKPEKGDVFICADGGYLYAEDEGIRPSAIIGDFDSIGKAPEFLDCSCSAGQPLPEIVRLPAEKDDTDTLACVKWGMAKGYRDFIIAGGLGGRFDHSYANVQTLSYLIDHGCPTWIIDGGNSLTMIAGSEAAGEASIPLTPSPGRKFSIFSYDERCEGVSVSGAKYGLDNAVLTQSFPIGVSNEFITGEAARVSVKKGKLLIMTSTGD